jgi:diguanylate cyclase (GGDEF)-like protein
MALSVAGLSGFAFDTPASEVGALVWLLALIPPFLFAYYKGWSGAAAALAAGMAMFILVEVVFVAYSGRQIAWPFIALTTVTMILVSLGAGALSESLLRQRAQALYMAYADSLTGLPNRRVLTFALRKFFAAAQRGRPLSLVILDVDGFKEYNESFGHHAGDQALRVIGEILDRNTRLMNVSGRFGGDEFLAIIPGETEAGATLFSDRVREAVEATRMPHGGRCTLSVGVASYAEGMRSQRDLIEAADEALFASKRRGGNQTVTLPSRQPAAASGPLAPSDLVANVSASRVAL